MGRIVSIIKLQKDDLIDAEDHQNAHSKTAENLDMKVGQCRFCLWLKDMISQEYLYCEVHWHDDEHKVFIWISPQLLIRFMSNKNRHELH